jgi:UDP-galactopyranose mutase
MEPEYDHTFYTGPIDAYFKFGLGRLGYRTVTFERIDATGDYQGNAVINYTELDPLFTRVHEHKHFAPWESHDLTVAFREFSKETEANDVPYYPKRLNVDQQLLAEYRSTAEKLRGVSFAGRLATYRYLDMDAVIDEALNLSAGFVESRKNGTPPPLFPNQEDPLS